MNDKDLITTNWQYSDPNLRGDRSQDLHRVRRGGWDALVERRKGLSFCEGR